MFVTCYLLLHWPDPKSFRQRHLRHGGCLFWNSSLKIIGNSSILSLQKQLLKFLIYLIVADLLYRFRGGFRAAATTKMELFMILVNGFHGFYYYHKALHLGYCSRPGSASEVGISFIRDSGKYSSQNQC